jgi:chromosomal replication initiation ATPase DnaA
VAIYLARRLRRDRLKQIGDAFQMNSYGLVSSAVEWLKAALARGGRLRKKVVRIRRTIAKSQKQT